MNISVRGTLKVVSVVIGVLLAAFWAFGYHSFEFKGGVGIHDSGFFSYPRYTAQIGAAPLGRDGEYQFTIRGLPPVPLDFVVLVPDITDDDRAQLMSSPTILSASIADLAGKEICTITGRLSDIRSKDPSTWIVTSIGSSASLWHPRCKQLRMSRFKTYIVRVRISGADSGSLQKIVMPVLQGGGNELP